MEARWGAAMPQIRALIRLAHGDFTVSSSIGAIPIRLWLISRDARSAIPGCRKGVIVSRLARTGRTLMNERSASPYVVFRNPRAAWGAFFLDH